MTQADRLGYLFEQVDDGHAAETEGAGPQRIAELGHVVEEDEDLELVGEPGARGGVDRHVHEEELLGKCEVFLQEPVAEEGARPIGQKSVVGVEADGPNGVAGKANRLQLFLGRTGPQLHLADVFT